MKQLNFLKQTSFKKEHGGSVSVGKRKGRRPLSTKTPVHLVLKSEIAIGPRALTRHRPHIEKVISAAKKRFNIRVYEMAVVYNHIHLLVKGKHRADLQNFFRMAAGHIAQEILRKCPLEKIQVRENQFWISRIYSRVVSWGKEFLSVKKYVIQNFMESAGLVPYRSRKRRMRVRSIIERNRTVEAIR